MPAQLSGKVAVITGASMGIGEALARLFVEEGASVVMTSRDQARVEAARARIGHPERTLALTCDVRNREEIDRVLSLTLHNFERVDIWVNNAGHGMNDSVELMDRDAYRRMFDTNLFGAIDGMQAAIPAMKRQGSGVIINISSVVGHTGNAGQIPYTMEKAALDAFTKSLAMELKDRDILVNSVAPGFIQTGMMEELPQEVKDGILSRIALGRVGKPEEVAQTALFLASSASSYVTGVELNVDGGLGQV